MLGANAEILFLTMAISAVITWIFKPEQLTDNPILRMVGYNNPCVFWDSPPALWVAFMLFTPTVYFSIRYAALDSMRAKSDPELGRLKYRIILVLNFWYAFSQCLTMGIFVVRPDDGTLTSMRLHGLCFIQLVMPLCMCISGNYLESMWKGDPLSKTQTMVLATYILVSILETVFAGSAVLLYKNDGVHVHNMYVMQAIDYAWFASLGPASIMMPHGKPLLIRVSEVSTVEVGFEGEELPHDEGKLKGQIE
ncbi:unnamed protein product [Polarella glacialis]|nr:unnamed protein product [Polarella glacialis]